MPFPADPLDRLIGPVNLVDAHILAPMQDVEAVTDAIAADGWSPRDPIWFFERVPVEQVAPDQPYPAPSRPRRARPPSPIVETIPLVLAHLAPDGPRSPRYALIDGRGDVTGEQWRSHALAWVRHNLTCCGVLRQTRPAAPPDALG